MQRRLERYARKNQGEPDGPRSKWQIRFAYIAFCLNRPQAYYDALGSCQFDQALRLLWESVTGLNQEIERAQPWRALREGKPEAIRGHLQRWRGALYDLGYRLAPFLPQASQEIQQSLSEAGDEGKVLFPRH
jgi:methionyl-tRNA synthetase